MIIALSQRRNNTSKYCKAKHLLNTKNESLKFKMEILKVCFIFTQFVVIEIIFTSNELENHFFVQFDCDKNVGYRFHESFCYSGPTNICIEMDRINLFHFTTPGTSSGPFRKFFRFARVFRRKFILALLTSRMYGHTRFFWPLHSPYVFEIVHIIIRISYDFENFNNKTLPSAQNNFHSLKRLVFFILPNTFHIFINFWKPIPLGSIYATALWCVEHKQKKYIDRCFPIISILYVSMQRNACLRGNTPEVPGRKSLKWTSSSWPYFIA